MESLFQLSLKKIVCDRLLYFEVVRTDLYNIPDRIRDCIIKFNADNLGYATYLCWDFGDGVKFCYDCGRAAVRNYEEFEENGGRTDTKLLAPLIKFNTPKDKCAICSKPLYQWCEIRSCSRF